MSRPAPNQKGSFAQMLPWMLLLWVATFMFMRPQQNQNQALNSQFGPLTNRAQYLDALRKCDLRIWEGTGQKIESEYNGLVDQDVTNKKLTKQQGDAAKIEGAVLVADAYYKAGLQTDDSNKIRTGYNTLQGYRRKMSDNPGWTQPVTLTQRDNRPLTLDAQQEFDVIVDTLKQRNRTDLVYGFIPGGWQMVDGLVHVTGAIPSFSYAFAAFFLALLVRGIVYPLAQKQFMFSRQMSQLTPRVKEIKERYPDPTTQNAKTMELYREYGINPFSGCLPAFIQMPLFLTVYQCMLHYQFQFQNGTFLWINPGLSKATHGFVAPNLGEQDYILIVIYGITMMISTLLTPVTDPSQKAQQRLIGVGFAIGVPIFMLFGFFPVVSGFVLYWTFTNILATAQALRAYRLPLPPLVRVNTTAGGVYPSKPKGRWAQMIDEMQHKLHEEQQRAMDAKMAEDSGKQAPAPEETKPSSNGRSANGKLPSQGKSPQKPRPKKG